MLCFIVVVSGGRARVFGALQRERRYMEIWESWVLGGASPVTSPVFATAQHLERRSDQRMTQSASTRTPSPSPVRSLRSLQHFLSTAPARHKALNLDCVYWSHLLDCVGVRLVLPEFSTRLSLLFDSPATLCWSIEPLKLSQFSLMALPVH